MSPLFANSDISRGHRSIFERMEGPLDSGVTVLKKNRSIAACTGDLRNEQNFKSNASSKPSGYNGDVDNDEIMLPSLRERSRSPIRTVRAVPSRQVVTTASSSSAGRFVIASPPKASRTIALRYEDDIPPTNARARVGRVYEVAIASLLKSTASNADERSTTQRMPSLYSDYQSKLVRSLHDNRKTVVASQAFIRNLPQSASSDELEKLLKRSSTVSALKIERGPLTTALVSFRDPDSAEKCADRYNGYKWQGYTLKVSVVDNNCQPGSQSITTGNDEYLPYANFDKSEEHPFLPSALPRPSIFERMA